jgi:hypothetical protein
MRKATFFLLAFAATCIAAQAKPFDLSLFKGSYAGSVFFGTQNGSAAGTANAGFKVQKSGFNGTLALSGIISDGNSSVPVSQTITLKKNGSIFISDFAPLLVQPPTPITGRFKGNEKRQKISAAIPWTFDSASGSSDVAIRLRRTKHRATLTVTYLLHVSGAPVNPIQTLVWTASRRIK